MPAALVYVGSREISCLLGISIREAQYQLNMFESKGKVLRFGKLKKVALRTLTDYVCEQDGSDPSEMYTAMRMALKEL